MTEEHADELLRQLLGLSAAGLGEMFGSSWVQVVEEPRAGDQFVLVPQDDNRLWFLGGEPPQVMLGVGEGLAGGVSLLVASPRGRWLDWRLGYEPHAPVHVHLGGDLTRMLADVSSRRRRTFRWCSCCRRLTPPETRHDARTCMSCAESVWGVVH